MSWLAGDHVGDPWKDAQSFPKDSVGRLMEPVVANGLEGVVVAETHLSRVDGQNGRLVIRGLDLDIDVADELLEHAVIPKAYPAR